MHARAHVLIDGRVQGVFFRSETRTYAIRNHVTGWVRNLADGRVEAVFEGEDENVKRLVDFCRKGTQRAKVTQVDVVWETYTGEFEDFEVRG